MKRILVVGENSYVGRSFRRYVGEACQVRALTVRGDDWRGHDFSQYDVVLHLAAIVHVKDADRSLYYRVNRDLPRDLCLQAVQQGVKHFIFMSTMAVYGVAPSLTGAGAISASTECRPGTIYGESKLAAEQELQRLRREHDFVLSIIRSPMIYGSGCPGNYFHRLMWMGRTLPVFPAVRANRIAMIGITNLCELIRLVIERAWGGIVCPQDQDRIGTQERLKIIAQLSGRQIHMSKLLGVPFRLLALRQLASLFGDLYYADDLDCFEGHYALESFGDAVKEIIRDDYRD